METTVVHELILKSLKPQLFEEHQGWCQRCHIELCYQLRTNSIDSLDFGQNVGTVNYNLHFCTMSSCFQIKFQWFYSKFLPVHIRALCSASGGVWDLTIKQAFLPLSSSLSLPLYSTFILSFSLQSVSLFSMPTHLPHLPASSSRFLLILLPRSLFFFYHASTAASDENISQGLPNEVPLLYH